MPPLTADPLPPCTIVIRYAYLLGGANMHAHLSHDSLGPSNSLHQTAARLVQPFLHDTAFSLYVTLLRRPISPQTGAPSLASQPITYIVLWALPTHSLKWHLDYVSHFFLQIHGRYQRTGQTDRPTDRQTTELEICKLRPLMRVQRGLKLSCILFTAHCICICVYYVCV